MNNEVFIAIVVNALYLIIWYVILRVRNSKKYAIRDLDNGNDFYESLNEIDKESYWKKDTSILNVTFAILFLFLEITLFFVYRKSYFWILTLVLGMLVSFITGIIMSIRLRREYK